MLSMVNCSEEGRFIISIPSLSNLEYLTILSPLFVYILLTRMSGINMLEKIADERYGHLEKYVQYKENTPVLFIKIWKWSKNFFSLLEFIQNITGFG